MDLSIVVPAFNEAALLPTTLPAIAEAAAPFGDGRWELIVCDNNSTDDTAAIARRYAHVVIHEPVNQIGRARNTGAAAARGEWLVFIDADSWPTSALMSDLRRAMADPKILYGGAALTMQDDGGRAGKVAIAGWHRLAQWQGWAAGSFFFVRRAAFAAVGGFDLTFYAAEEIDLSNRLRRLAKTQGQRFAFLKEAPLATSARKLHFHTPWHHLRFMAWTVLTGGRTLRRRDACGIWYDGKR
jgi:glycosyltransferase involved in cell wall biosynthesis